MSQVVLDFTDDVDATDPVNDYAESIRLTVSPVVGDNLYKYEGDASDIFDLGKYIGQKGYDVVIGSKKEK